MAIGKPAFFRDRSRGSVPGQAKILEYRASQTDADDSAETYACGDHTTIGAP